MPLIAFDEILADARRRRYAVGCFEVWDIFSARAALAAAEAENSPLIVSVRSEDLALVEPEDVFLACRHTVEQSAAPAALILGGARSVEDARIALECGVNGVSVDISTHKLRDTVSLTSDVMHLAAENGATVEATLRLVADSGPGSSGRGSRVNVTPAEAVAFAEQTGICSLNMVFLQDETHLETEPKLELKLMERVSSEKDLPIAFRSFPGIFDEDIWEAIGLGAAKIDVGAEIRRAFFEGLRDMLSRRPSRRVPTEIYGSAMEAEMEIIVKKMRTYGSSDKTHAFGRES